MENHSQFRLFRTRRFRPFFFTQALGAFNDNLYKTGLLLYVTFVASQQSGELNSDLLVNLAAGLFILPFFLFSPMARSEEHTSELQSRPHLVCRLLLEKKKH